MAYESLMTPHRFWLLLVGMLLTACQASTSGSHPPLRGVVVDNESPAMRLEGVWQIVEARGSYGENCARADVNPIIPNEHGYIMFSGATSAYAYVHPPLPAAGTYEIFAWWCRPRRSAARSLEIQVHPTTGFVAYQIAQLDLTQDHGRWVSLGQFYLEQDGSLSLSNSEGATDGEVIVDAFRFVYRSAAYTFQAPTPPVPPPLPSPTALPSPPGGPTPPPVATRGP